MKINRKILVSIFMMVIIILSVGCSNSILNNKEEIDFPKDDKGYPQGNIVLVNGKDYILENIEKSTVSSHITHEIDLKLEEKADDIVEVILSQNNPINLWSIQENEDIDLISYNKLELKIEDKNMLEGVSARLQKFSFRVPTDKSIIISFKWANVNEIEKSFKDKKENYLLKIKISH